GGAIVDVGGLHVLAVAEHGAVTGVALRFAAALQVGFAVDVAGCLAVDLAVHVDVGLARALARGLALGLAARLADVAARAALALAGRLARGATLAAVRRPRAARVAVGHAAALTVGLTVEVAALTLGGARRFTRAGALDVGV